MRRREIAREFHRDFALYTQSYEAAARNSPGAVQYGIPEYHSGTRIRDTEKFLHHRGGAADLVTGLTTHPGYPEQSVEHPLQGVSLCLGLRAQCQGKIGNRLEGQALIEQQSCRLQAGCAHGVLSQTQFAEMRWRNCTTQTGNTRPRTCVLEFYQRADAGPATQFVAAPHEKP
jgi:hypothetical protein